MTADTMTAAADLTGLADDQLAAMFASGDETTRGAVLAECQRQDAAADRERKRREWRASPAGQRYAAADAAWTDASHAEFLAAEAACRGRLLAPGAPARDPWPMLWTCSERDLDRWASEEFKRWREYDAASFTRRADLMRQAARPRAGEAPWHEPGREETTVERKTVAPSAEDLEAAEDAAAEARKAERAQGAREREERRLQREARAASASVAVMAPSAVIPAAGGLAPRRPEIDGARLLEQIGLFIIDHVALPSPAAAVALTLWAAHERARDADGQLIWRASPRLLLTSSENGAGKSTALDVLAILCQSRAGRIGTVTAPGLAQLVGRLREVALLDEAQLTFGAGRRAEQVRLIINSGYTRRGHCLTGQGGKTSLTPVFGACALAGLDSLIHGTDGRLADTLSRCIIVRMQRPPRRMPELDERGEIRGARLAAALAAWTASERDTLRRAALDLADAAADGSDGLDGLADDGGRTVQLWRALLSVADTAGGQCPRRPARPCGNCRAAPGISWRPPRPWPPWTRPTAARFLTRPGAPSERPGGRARRVALLARVPGAVLPPADVGRPAGPVAGQGGATGAVPGLPGPAGRDRPHCAHAGLPPLAGPPGGRDEQTTPRIRAGLRFAGRGQQGAPGPDCQMNILKFIHSLTMGGG
jgi:hypothetical protein